MYRLLERQPKCCTRILGIIGNHGKSKSLLKVTMANFKMYNKDVIQRQVLFKRLLLPTKIREMPQESLLMPFYPFCLRMSVIPSVEDSLLKGQIVLIPSLR